MGHLSLWSEMRAPDFQLALFPLLKPLMVKQGDFIFHRGSSSRDLLLLLSGQVHVVRSPWLSLTRPLRAIYSCPPPLPMSTYSCPPPANDNLLLPPANVLGLCQCAAPLPLPELVSEPEAARSHVRLRSSPNSTASQSRAPSPPRVRPSFWTLPRRSRGILSRAAHPAAALTRP